MSYWSLEYLMGGWRPTIGDPGFMGWFTVGSYFACALVALIAVFINQRRGRGSCFFWSTISLLMILLGINKQLDLQTLFTEVGRQIAKAQGWMDQRRIVEFWFIVAFGTTVLSAFLLFAFILGDLFRRFMLAFTGLFFLLSFIFIRAASFHHFDEILGFTLLGARMNWVPELTGIYLILVAGIREIIYLRMINEK
jgi:hypothetical protein